MFRRLRACACFLLVALSASGCVSLATAPVCDSFEGISAALERESSVSIFVSHGMNGYSEGDPDCLISAITQSLNLSADGPGYLRPIINAESGKTHGYVQRHDFRVPYTPQKVHIYVLDWRQSTWAEKAIVRRIDETDAKKKRRVDMIHDLKQNFMTGGLGDVLLYLGKHKRDIEYPFEQTVRWIYEDAKDDPKHEIMIVNFSLGSQILLNTLDDMGGLGESGRDDAEAQAIRKAFIQQTTAFFMVSNQAPMLYLSMLDCKKQAFTFKTGKECRESDFCDPLYTPTYCLPEEPNKIPYLDWTQTSLGHFVMERRNTLPGFQVVVLKDPNDILHYDICTHENPHCGCGTDKDLVINVEVRNAKQAWLGSFVHPAKAHQTYGQNGLALDFITHGHSCD